MLYHCVGVSARCMGFMAQLDVQLRQCNVIIWAVLLWYVYFVNNAVPAMDTIFAT